MKHASKLAVEQEWVVLQEQPRPLLSSAACPLDVPLRRGEYSETTSLLLESSDAQRRIELLFNWNNFTVTRSSLKASPIDSSTGQLMDVGKWESRTTVIPNPNHNTHFRDQFLALFTSN